MTTIKVRGVNRIVKQTGLLFILAVHPFETALFFEPPADQIDDVNAPCIRSVVKRFVFSVGSIVEHRVQPLGYPLKQIVTDDDERYATGTHVLLRACINEAV